MAILQNKSQHIYIIEIECNTPLLTNIYYNYENQIFSGLQKGDIVIKNVEAKKSFSFTLASAHRIFYYSISAFNPIENPDISFTFDDTKYLQIKENSLQSGFLSSIPYNVYVVNNGASAIRFIFKFAYQLNLNLDGTMNIKILKENYILMEMYTYINLLLVIIN